MTHAHRTLLKWARLLHVYLTLFGFALLFLFSVTGFMLNHEDWFLPRQSTTGKISPQLLGTPEDRDGIIEKLRGDFDVQGEVDTFTVDEDQNAFRIVFKSDEGLSEALIQRGDGATVVTHDHDKSRERITVMEGTIPLQLLTDKAKELLVVETLRKDFAAHGEVNSFTHEKESEAYRVVFKAPGYLATATIQTKDGQTRVTHQTRGVVGVLLDLHRGKDSGLPWSFVIDGVSILFVIASITGLILWSSLRGRAQHGLAVLTLGLALGLFVYFLYVPR